jgi:hypothetical protein
MRLQRLAPPPGASSADSSPERLVVVTEGINLHAVWSLDAQVKLL